MINHNGGQVCVQAASVAVNHGFTVFCRTCEIDDNKYGSQNKGQESRNAFMIVNIQLKKCDIKFV
jgi:hypothetical protein